MATCAEKKISACLIEVDWGAPRRGTVSFSTPLAGSRRRVCPTSSKALAARPIPGTRPVSPRVCTELAGGARRPEQVSCRRRQLLAARQLHLAQCEPEGRPRMSFEGGGRRLARGGPYALLACRRVGADHVRPVGAGPSAEPASVSARRSDKVAVVGGEEELVAESPLPQPRLASASRDDGDDGAGRPVDKAGMSTAAGRSLSARRGCTRHLANPVMTDARLKAGRTGAVGCGNGRPAPLAELVETRRTKSSLRHRPSLASLHSPRYLFSMSKKHITNDPKHLVIDALKGVVALNDKVELDEEYKGQPPRPRADPRSSALARFDLTLARPLLVLATCDDSHLSD